MNCYMLKKVIFYLQEYITNKQNNAKFNYFYPSSINQIKKKKNIVYN